MKILIVGAGIGGLTLAAFLKKFDIDFEILEKNQNWNKQGYSLGLWSNGRNILKKLGLENKFDENAEAIQDFIVCNGKERVLKKYNLKDFYVNYGSAYAHLNRQLLHRWLLDLVGENKISMGSEIKSLENFTNYDLIVGADGMHSKLRNLVFDKTDYEHYDEFRVWLAWIDNKFKKNKSVVQYLESGQFISIFDDKDRTLAVFIAAAKHLDWDNEEGRVERLKSIFNKHFKIKEILFGVKDSDVIPTDLCFIKMKKWAKGNFVLLGDSAHGMEPFMGLGASMAMEDAYILAGELLKVKSGEKTINEALYFYEKTRKPRIELARNATFNMKWWTLNKSAIFNYVVYLLSPIIPTSFFARKLHKLLSKEI